MNQQQKPIPIEVFVDATTVLLTAEQNIWLHEQLNAGPQYPDRGTIIRKLIDAEILRGYQ